MTITLKEKLREQEGIVFPAGKIVLLDGREINCYPREEGGGCNVDYNNIELDTTKTPSPFGYLPLANYSRSLRNYKQVCITLTYSQLCPL